jgi:hypothetical protein
MGDLGRLAHGSNSCERRYAFRAAESGLEEPPQAKSYP